MFVFNLQIIFHSFVDDNPLTVIKTGPCCNIINTSVEIGVRNVLQLTLYMYVISQSFVSLTIPIIVLYCTLCKDIIRWL
jgi:hypothetical protein